MKDLTQMYKPKKESFKHRCHVRIWSKWRHFLSLFWLTVTLPHRKWSETTYLRDKQCKKNLQVLLQEIASWNLSDAWRPNNNKNNENSDSSQFYSYFLIARTERLRSEAESSAGEKQIFNVGLQFLSSFLYFMTCSLTIFGSADIWADILCPASQWKCLKSDIRSSAFNN